MLFKSDNDTSKPGASSVFEYILILCALCSFAFAQPLFSSLSNSATFFVAHNAASKHVILFAIIIALAVPVSLVVFTYLSKFIFGKWHVILLDCIIFTLGIFIGLTFFRDILPQNPYLTILAAFAFSFILSLAIKKLSILRTILSFASIAVLVAPFMFLNFSQVSQLVWNEKVTEVVNEEVDSDVPIIFVVFDEFNPVALLDDKGRIDPVRFPGFHKLSQKSTWYPNASSVHVQSVKAVPALLTGLNPPKRHRIPSVSAYPKNIFTLLGGSYNFNVIENFTALCPVEYCFEDDENKNFNRVDFISDIVVVTQHTYYPRKWAKEKLPPLDSGWKNFQSKVGGGEDASHEASMKNSTDDSADALAESRIKNFSIADPLEGFEEFIDGIEENQRGLNLIHTLLPHSPWVYLPDGRKYQFDNPGPIWESQAKADEGYHRYLMQLGASDQLISKLIDRLERLNLIDEAIIVVTADHGLVFREGVHKRGKGSDSIPGHIKATALRIPLFIKYPKQRSRKIDRRFVQNIDILPTLMKVLNSKVKFSEFDGQSLISPAYVEKKKIQFTHWNKKNVFSKREILGGVSVLDRIEKFGQKSPLNSLRIMGKYSDLYSKTLQDFNEMSKDTRLAPRLDFSGKDFTEVNLEGSRLPALLIAPITIKEESNAQFHVALILNGKVASIVPVIGKGKTRSVRALLPPALFVDGKNILTAFLIQESQVNKRSILRVAIDSNDYELKGGRIKKKGLNVFYDLDKGRKGGSASFSSTRGAFVANGWSADIKAGRCAKEVLFFHDSKYLGWAETGLPTSNLAKVRNKKTLAKCRFRFTIDEKLSSSSEKFQVFGLFKDNKSIEVTVQE